MAQEDAVVVRPAPVARLALAILPVVRTIRNFLVNPPNQGSWDLTVLYDFCMSSLFQVVYPHPEGIERAMVALRELRQAELDARRGHARRTGNGDGTPDTARGAATGDGGADTPSM